jgi:hypothetical protein
MKKTILILLIISSFQNFAQKDKKQIKFSGEYIGKFTDLKKNTGTMELFLYQSNNGFSEGIVKMNKNDSKIITGVIRINGNENFISGNFSPSEIKNNLWNNEKTKESIPKDSYECGWNFFGELKKEGIIIGKAVPTNCSESNLIEFTLNRKK